MSSRENTKKVFDKLIPLLLNEKYDEVSKVLDNLDVTKVKGKQLISYLSATNPWKNTSLKKSRDKILEITESKLIDELGNKRSKEILKGFK